MDEAEVRLPACPAVDRRQTGVGFLVQPLGQTATTGLIVGIAGAVLASFWAFEGLISNVVFTAAVTTGLVSSVVLATRRLLFATVSVALLVVMINAIASAKQLTIGMVLHAYDVVFYLGSWSTVAYLWSGARLYVVATLAGSVLFGVLAWLAWHLDGTRVARSPAVAVLAASIAMAGATGLTKPDRRQTQFYWNALYVSSFYASWAETIETLWRGQLIESAPQITAAPFGQPGVCNPVAKPPHIMLIHQESVVQPSLFAQLAYDRSLDPFFKSGNGRLQKMRVETYGGASWLTEFSVLTGLSTYSFGGMRPFVQSLLAGKVRDTLPEVLTRCGYRNVLFYPMLRNFVSNDRFYHAVGMREIFDQKAQGAKSDTERDLFYYDNALAEMEKHVAGSRQPLFSYIQTMSAHWPYNHTYAPEMKVPGGGTGTDPEMHEYLRRVAIAKIDYDYLKSELKRRFPGEPILIVHYGDHHPMATRKMLGFAEDTLVEEVAIGPQSIGYITYFAAEALGYDAPPLPDHDTIDVPYLGAIILQQAGLPLSEAWRERVRLMAACNGAYNGCSRRQEILAFHRRLIDSQIIDER